MALMHDRNFGNSQRPKIRTHTSFGRVRLPPSSGVQDSAQSMKLRPPHLPMAVDFILLPVHPKNQPDSAPTTLYVLYCEGVRSPNIHSRLWPCIIARI